MFEMSTSLALARGLLGVATFGWRRSRVEKWNGWLMN